MLKTSAQDKMGRVSLSPVMVNMVKQKIWIKHHQPKTKNILGSIFCVVFIAESPCMTIINNNQNTGGKTTQKIYEPDVYISCTFYYCTMLSVCYVDNALFPSSFAMENICKASQRYLFHYNTTIYHHLRKFYSGLHFRDTSQDISSIT